MAFLDYFKSPQKRFEEAADVEVNIFKKNSQLLKDELNTIEKLNSNIVHFKKAETGIDGKKEIEKFKTINSSFFKVIDEVEKIYEKDRKILLSIDYLEQEERKSEAKKSIEWEIVKQKAALLNKLGAYSINLIDEVADFVGLNESIPDAEITSIRESLAKILRDLLESAGDLFSHKRLDPETLQHARNLYNKWIQEFNAEYIKTREKQERKAA